MIQSYEEEEERKGEVFVSVDFYWFIDFVNICDCTGVWYIQYSYRYVYDYVDDLSSLCSMIMNILLS